MPHNFLLASLPAEEWAKWHPHFERVPLKYRQELLRPGEPLSHLWFLENGIASQVIETVDGASVEVAVIGAEGLIGLPAVFGVNYTALRTVIQMESSALRVDVDAFHRNLHRKHPLLRRIERYAVAVMGGLAQVAACNRLHRVEQRLCRWLLAVHDRVQCDRIPMTHEFLSFMLGTRRASVSDAAQALAERNLIRYEPGTIEYVDIAGLEEFACECYTVIRRLYREALPRGERGSGPP